MSDKIREALQGMLDIVDDSEGVAGYHRNGVIAEWHDFPEVDAARAALAQQPAPAVPVAQEPVQMHHEPHNRAMWPENCPGRRFSSPMKPRGDGSWECGVCGAVGRVTAPPSAEQPDSVAVPREDAKELLDALLKAQMFKLASKLTALLAGGDKP